MKKIVLIVSLVFSFGFLNPALAGEGQYCPQKTDGKLCQEGKCGQKGHHGPFKGSIKYALHHLDLDKGTWGDIKIAFKAYRESMQQIKRGIPIKSLDNGKFNKALFIKEHPMHQRIAAKAELLETIYLILNDAQKKKFQMLIGAHQYKMQNVGNNGCYSCGECAGKMCQTPGQCPGGMCQGKLKPIK